MKLQPNYLYHIYNQGNNRREIFFNRDNYLFFKMKIKKHVTPFADVLAWCLMPNHFHLMVLVKGGGSQGLTLSGGEADSQGLTSSGGEADSQGLTSSQTLTTSSQDFNHSIGVMLRSYTRAINKQEGFTGSLFRKETKAECLNCPEGLAPSFYTVDGITEINVIPSERQYPQVCFNYIHRNPVKAGLAPKAGLWEFSSAAEYESPSKNTLANKTLADEIGLIYM